jgi:hypothetical protein
MKGMSTIMFVLLVAVAAGVAINLPDIKRYLQMRSM